jgi:hypothetical protein
MLKRCAQVVYNLLQRGWVQSDRLYTLVMQRVGVNYSSLGQLLVIPSSHQNLFAQLYTRELSISPLLIDGYTRYPQHLLIPSKKRKRII